MFTGVAAPPRSQIAQHRSRTSHLAGGAGDIDDDNGGDDDDDDNDGGHGDDDDAVKANLGDA